MAVSFHPDPAMRDRRCSACPAPLPFARRGWAATTFLRLPPKTAANNEEPTRVTTSSAAACRPDPRPQVRWRESSRRSPPSVPTATPITDHHRRSLRLAVRQILSVVDDAEVLDHLKAEKTPISKPQKWQRQEPLTEDAVHRKMARAHQGRRQHRSAKGRRLDLLVRVRGRRAVLQALAQACRRRPRRNC